ncbi:PucR family transcriptional regulator [Corynebacterium comes]|uniref:PucR C-terminal helix-turn-helix domain-containing protein n=1 Tax=Corynebacterium comes TaxID=2675218 RepID=A0A6B8WFB1_9CORY|nr:helix-turn-helix domain-containing protein [Corynebacterium comes]QGU05368.1 hypothetical protein CETAM_10615 [Corynebacterium comes]
MDHLPELDDAVQDLAEATGRRLVVMGQSMRVVAYSIHESPEDRRRLFHLLAHSDAWPHPRTTSKPCQVETFPEVGPLVFLRLSDPQRHTVGYLVTPAPEDGADCPALTDAAPLLAELLRARQHESADRTEHSRRLTVALTTGSPHEREAAAAALIAERFLSDAEGYCAVALGVDPRDPMPLAREKTAQAVSRTLKFVRETSTATVIGGITDTPVGILVFPRPVVVPRLIRILEHPQVAPVRAGVGPLLPLADVHSSFVQAHLAWRASWLAPADHEIVTTWDGAGLDATLARLPLEDFTLTDLPPSTRDLLSAIDSPDLLTTLEAYLDAGGDAQRTSRELNIHRSTLYYRLDKLRTAVVGDLSDGILRRDLHTGLRMARLAGLVPTR